MSLDWVQVTYWKYKRITNQVLDLKKTCTLIEKKNQKQILDNKTTINVANFHANKS
jgi:hypothetical protein